MFYYKRHIGDYRSATNHLTLLEHGVYCCLMDTYYLNEKALPKDDRQLFRIAGARTDEEKQAVIDVVNEFFIPKETHWVHSRIDFELNEYHSKADTNRENGKKGGRPKKNPPQKPNENPVGFDSLNIETQTDSETKPKENPNETLTNEPINPLTNEPIIEDISSDKPKSFSFKSELKKLGIDGDMASEFMAVRKTKKASNTERALKSLLSEITLSGLTPIQAIGYCLDRQTPWGAFKNEWYQNEVKKQSFQNNSYQQPQNTRMQEIEQLSKQWELDNESNYQPY